ncbi:MAG: hypothetical protein WC707_04740 [Candidatus Babeliaceae bacterium]|jgi:hypothetical protein
MTKNIIDNIKITLEILQVLNSNSSKKNFNKKELYEESDLRDHMKSLQELRSILDSLISSYKNPSEGIGEIRDGLLDLHLIFFDIVFQFHKTNELIVESLSKTEGKLKLYSKELRKVYSKKKLK